MGGRYSLPHLLSVTSYSLSFIVFFVLFHCFPPLHWCFKVEQDFSAKGGVVKVFVSSRKINKTHTEKLRKIECKDKPNLLVQDDR